MNRNPNRRFSPVPARAFRDERLSSGRHFRLLGIIALHDRLGGNGRGCTASQRRLAKLMNCDEAWTSHTPSDLRSAGYVETTIDPTNRRRRVHRVIYTAEDANWGRDTCDPAQGSTCGRTQVSTPDTCAGSQVRLEKNGGK